jgi:hypothetical protein
MPQLGRRELFGPLAGKNYSQNIYITKKSIYIRQKPQYQTLIFVDKIHKQLLV